MPPRGSRRPQTRDAGADGGLKAGDIHQEKALPPHQSTQHKSTHSTQHLVKRNGRSSHKSRQRTAMINLITVRHHGPARRLTDHGSAVVGRTDRQQSRPATTALRAEVDGPPKKSIARLRILRYHRQLRTSPPSRSPLLSCLITVAWLLLRNRLQRSVSRPGP